MATDVQRNNYSVSGKIILQTTGNENCWAQLESTGVDAFTVISVSAIQKCNSGIEQQQFKSESKC